MISCAKAALGTLSQGLNSWFAGSAAYIFSVVTVYLPLVSPPIALYCPSAVLRPALPIPKFNFNPSWLLDRCHAGSICFIVSIEYITLEFSCL